MELHAKSAKHNLSQHIRSLEVQTKATKSQKGKAKAPEQPIENEYMMSGALRVEDPFEGQTQKPRGRARAAVRKQPDEGQKRALDELIKRKEEAERERKVEQVNVVSTKTAPAAKSGEARRGLGSSTRKAASPTIAPSKLRRIDVEGAPDREKTPPLYDPDDDLYGLSPGGEISLARIQAEKATGISQQKITTAPPSALRVRSTPAAEASILALANFKRRPRQPSIIRQIQLASETGDRYELDDLEPEDESTPLNLDKRRTRSSLDWQNGKSEAPATSSSRKRKFSEVQVPASQSSPLLASSPPPSVSKGHSLPKDDESDLPEGAIPSTEREDAEPTIYSETMADPRSSSSLSLPTMHDTTSGRHTKSRRALRNGQDAMTVSAMVPKTRQTKSRANAMSTAALQSLLPKPRRRQRTAAAKANSAFEILSSNDSDVEMRNVEDEEPAAPPARRRRRAAEAMTPARKQGGGRLRKPTLSPVSARKAAPQAQGPARGVSSEVKGKKTYGRRRRDEEDKENDSVAAMSDDGEDSEDEGLRMRRARSRTKEVRDVAVSKELEAVRKKFAEVDEWEMEFESVDLGGTSSSWR